MELQGARTVVVGATGSLGRGLVEKLLAAGAKVVPLGRDPGRLATVAEACGTEGISLDVVDAEACRHAVTAAVDQLGGLDLLVVTVGVPAFGPAAGLDPAVSEELFAVNLLGPMNVVRAAAPRLQDGKVVVLSAILADVPTAGMADYSAAKSALSVWLGLLAKEERRRFSVLDVRPPHLDTGLDQRALAGEPPRLPAPFPAERVVTAVLDAVAGDARELVWDAEAKDLRPR